MISEETINLVKEKSDIVQTIGESVELKRKGSSNFGLCPFHGEKSPSFSVSDEGFYHCFGCGESGNVFSFLMKYRGLSFPEAVTELAEKHGIPVSHTGNKSSQEEKTNHKEKQELHELLRIVMQYYCFALKKAPDLVTSYVASRKLTPQIIEEYGIGFAPNEWNSLVRVLEKKGFSEDLQLLSGLVRRGPKGDLYDTFRGRLIFPVAISKGRYAGFGGRIIPDFEDDKTPKYINSPESPVYYKSKILYGIPEATSSIRQLKNLYLVEGYMDVVSLAQEGLRNVIATCGTSVADGHVEKISRLTNRVKIVFDGDDAGRKAAGRLFPLFLGSGVDVKVLLLGESEDPDTMARLHGDKVSEVLESYPSYSLLECYLSSLVESYGVASQADLGPALKGKLCQQVYEVISKIKNPIEKHEHVLEASEYLHVDTQALLEVQVRQPPQIDKTTTREVEIERESNVVSIQKNRVVSLLSALSPLDRALLQIAMVHKSTLPKKILHSHKWCEVLHPASLSFVSELFEVMDNDNSEDSKKNDIQFLLKKFGKEWIDHWKESYQMHLQDETSFERSYKECLQKRAAVLIERDISKLEEKIRHSNDADEQMRLTQARLELVRKMKL